MNKFEEKDKGAQQKSDRGDKLTPQEKHYQSLKTYLDQKEESAHQEFKIKNRWRDFWFSLPGPFAFLFSGFIKSYPLIWSIIASAAALAVVLTIIVIWNLYS